MKNVFRKAAIAVFAIMVMSATISAQEQGDMAVGGNVVIGVGDSFTNYGLGAKFQYNVTSPLRLEGSFTYFLKKDYVTMWDLSLNAHWLFPIAENIAVYPLAGIGLLNSGVDIDLGLGELGIADVSSSQSDLVFNLGGGIDYRLTNKLILNAEVKYKISDLWDRSVISVGLAYKF